MSSGESIPSGDQRPLVRFRRRGGSPPPDWEVLEVTVGGRFRLWRSVVRAPAGRALVGRFAGALPDAELDTLKGALVSCTGTTGGAGGPPPADASMDTFRTEGGELTLPADAAAPPPWRDAVGTLRGLLDSLTGHPLATIRLEVSAGARLVHEGMETLDLDLSAASIRVARRDGDVASGAWSAPLAGPRNETASPGWRFELPFGHTFDRATPLTVAVEGFLAFDGEFWRTCALQANVPGG